MDIKELRDDVEWLSFTAGMNQRYHQSLAAKFGMYERWTEATVGVLAVASLVLSVASSCMDSGVATGFSLTFAVFTALAGVFMNVIGWGDDRRLHLDIFRRWSDLRQDVDTVKLRANETEEATEELMSRLRELTFKKNSLNALETAPDKVLLNTCYEDENKSRHDASTPEEYAAKLAEAASKKPEMAGA